MANWTKEQTETSSTRTVERGMPLGISKATWGCGGPPAASVRRCALTAERLGPSHLVLHDSLHLLQGVWCIITSVDLALLP